jgi:beta-lactamase regulating signal transducer with metallopeptidase domain
MTAIELFSEQWLVRTAIAGGAVLLAGVVWMLATRQPARRQWFGQVALLCSLLVAGLCALPAWLPVALPLCTPKLERSPIVEEAPAPTAAGAASDTVAPLDDSFAWVLLSDELPSAEAAPEMSRPAAAAVSPPKAALSPAPGNGWLSRLETLYFGLTAAFMANLLLGYFGLQRLRKRSKRPPARIAAIFAEVTGHWRRPPQLAVCDKLTTPVSFGLWRPIILIPPIFCRLHCEDQLRWVLVHELTHLERRDAWGCLLLALGQLVYFYLPWYWWLRGQVRLAQEYLADAAAAALSSSEDYAQYLLSLSAKVDGQRLALCGQPSACLIGSRGSLSTGVIGTSSELFRRVTMLLNSQRQVETSCPRWWSGAATASLLALAVLASGVGVRADEPKDSNKKNSARAPVEVIVELAGDEAGKEKKEIEVILDGARIKEHPEKVILAQASAARLRIGRMDEPVILQDGGQDPKSRRIKELDEALKRLDEAAKKANVQLSDDTKKQLEDLQKQLEKVRKQADDELAKARDQALKQAGEYRRSVVEALARAGQAHQDGQRLHLWAQQPRTRLGAQVQSPSETLASQLDLPKDQGLVIEHVLPDSAAAKAGIQNHDILVEFDGKPVSSDPMQFVKAVQAVKADSSVDAVVLRKGKKVTVKGIKLSEVSKEGAHSDYVLRFDGDSKAFKEFKLAQIPKADFFAGSPNSVSTTVIRRDDKFTARHRDGSLSIVVSGAFADNKLKASEITIKDGDTDLKFESLDNVPEKYRDTVKRLLEMAEKGQAHSEAKEKTKSKN